VAEDIGKIAGSFAEIHVAPKLVADRHLEAEVLEEAVRFRIVVRGQRIYGVMRW
jgi:UDP-N-acetylglucosamine 2-epimerase